MTSLPPSAALPPQAERASDPLEQALVQARAAGAGPLEVAALDTWLELRRLLRDKRPEQALSALDAWLAELRADHLHSSSVQSKEVHSGGPQLDTPSPDAQPPAEAPPPRTAVQVQALLRDPQLPAHLRALSSLKRWQSPDEAQRALAGALRHPLTRAEGWNLLGVLAAEASDPQQAGFAFAQALAADPGHYRALTNRAGLAAERGDDACAETDLRRALELNPDHHAAWQNLGVVLRRQGKRGEAVQALKRAQRLDYRQSGTRSSDQARRELAGLPRMPRAAWTVLGLLLFFMWLWLSGSAGRAP
ncbi:MAG: tetratricopeptide repeat protein [Deinococcus sp.]|nr:tetratricopeptide repeat protein [Deinococcus sp.]